MAKRIIPIEVRDEYILGAGRVIGAKGSHDDVALRVEFNEMWRGKSITAVWLNAVGESPVVAPINFSNWEGSNPLICIIDIPAKAKSAVGDAMLTIRGFTSVDGETESTATLTATAYFKVLESDFDNEAEEEEEEDKLNLYQKLQNSITALDAKMSNAIDARNEALNLRDETKGYRDESENHMEAAAISAGAAAGSANTAAGSASNASDFADEAGNYADAAKSWAVGGVYQGDDTNNAKYWNSKAEKAQAAAEAAQEAAGIAKGEAQTAKGEAIAAKNEAQTAYTNANGEYKKAVEEAGKAAASATAAKSSADTAAEDAAAKAAENVEYRLVGYVTQASGEVAKAEGEVAKAAASVQTASDKAAAAARSASSAESSAAAAAQSATRAANAVSGLEDTAAYLEDHLGEVADAEAAKLQRVADSVNEAVELAAVYKDDAWMAAERAEDAADRAEAAGGVSKGYVDEELEKKLDKTGGTITDGEYDTALEAGEIIVTNGFASAKVGCGGIDIALDSEGKDESVIIRKNKIEFSHTYEDDETGETVSKAKGIVRGLANATDDSDAVPYGQMVEYVAANGGGSVSNVAYDATPLVTATATDPDGNTYTGATEYEVTVPEVEELYVGLQIVVVPTMKSATDKPFITVNGARGRIYTNAATTGSYFNGTRVDFIGANKPLALMYMGIVDETSGMGGWKCLNSVRVNVEALMSNGEAGVNKIPMSNGVGEKLVWRTHKDANLVGDATYNSSANRYDVTLPGIGNTETGDNGVYKGLEVTIIPNVTNKAYAKLAVNNYDGAASGSQIYLSTGDGTGGFVSPPAGFLKAGMPVKMKYTGAGWRITDTPYSVFGKNGGTLIDEDGISTNTIDAFGMEIDDADLSQRAKLDVTGVYFTVETDEGKVAGGGRISGLMDATLDHEAVPYGQMKAELDVVKTSVSEGKSLIASAVTDKGVTTAGDATFAQMAANIAAIESGGVELPELANEGTSADLRKDKELINGEGEVVIGTMETFNGSYECSDDGTGGIKPIIDSLDITPTATDRTYDATEEGLDGYSPVVVRGDGNLAPENIVEGVSIFGVTGTAKTDVEPNLQDIDITPSYMDKIYNASDGYDGFGEVYVNGDPNLVPENVVEGVKIFDVTGTAKTGGGGGETVTLTIKPLGPMGISGVLCYIDGEGKSQLATTKGTVTALKGSYASCINGGDGTMQTGNQTLYTGTFGSVVFVVEADGVVKI